MAKLETALSLEQILEGMRQLSEQEKRALASIILSDPKLEAFVEELDDNLTCERAVNEGPPEPFSPDELTQHEPLVIALPASASSITTFAQNPSPGSSFNHRSHNRPFR